MPKINIDGFDLIVESDDIQCSCHTMPPCSFCTQEIPYSLELAEIEEDLYEDELIPNDPIDDLF